MEDDLEQTVQGEGKPRAKKRLSDVRGLAGQGPKRRKWTRAEDMNDSSDGSSQEVENEDGDEEEGEEVESQEGENFVLFILKWR